MKNGGRIPWNATAICETYKISCLMGKLLTNGDSVNLLLDQIFHLVQWPNITIFSSEDQSRLHQFGPKVLPGIFLGYALHAARIWKGDILVADIEELEKMDCRDCISSARESYQEYSTVTCCTRRGSGKEADIVRIWEIWDASDIHARRLNAREVLMPKNGEFFIFRSNSQVVWKKSSFPKIHLNSGSPCTR